jgi:hypothetical protein
MGLGRVPFLVEKKSYRQCQKPLMGFLLKTLASPSDKALSTFLADFLHRLIAFSGRNRKTANLGFGSESENWATRG